MIIDTLNNGSKYTSLHPLFAKAFDFINQNDIAALEDGTIQIEEGLKVIVSKANGKTRETSLAKFECHDKNIDIQVCVKGLETIAWKPREKCVTPNGDYNPEKDVRFFNDTPDMDFQLTDGQFVIFYPGDVHAPMIGEGEIKKLVFKVKI
ncbi:YhcH/YjgK/YiaL family protein [Flavobacterium sp.]|uniref:YhcH/YjgK/YiaL family protein n=1 Tax=Flavobacterium sp. TaxID=239 RepID=UPI002BBF9FA8|nr:YhcH/YjgK/YiaL family protein [Flavobacterium sp.]HSD08414.1 YhcH/YjgK/YiaL family protein [Flavobacterium sp.]